MAAMRFTKTIIDDLPTTGEQYVVWCDDLEGFGVRVGQAGTKTFILKYRLPSGRVRWKKLGRTSTIALDKARRYAKDDIGIVARGGDPLTDKDAARDALTVATAADQFLTWIEANRAADTHRMYRQCIDASIRPKLGALAITDVTTDTAVKLHTSLRETPTQANHVIRTLSSLLTWCMKQNYVPRQFNPCRGVEFNEEHKRAVYLAAPEYGRLGKALKSKEISVSRLQRVAIELLILTGARPKEIATAKWDFVTYFADGTGRITLPEHKTRRKTKAAKPIHLPPEAVKLLKSWPRHAHSPYIFPGTGRGEKRGVHLHPNTLSDVWVKLRKQAKLEGVRLYDACRHSWASQGISVHGLSLAQVGGQLGHSQPATTDRYAHLHDQVARDQATLVGGSIAKLLKRRA
jgi:integrase